MKFSSSQYIPKNPEKYIGTNKIIARSSWETTFMTFLDNSPSIIKWASESIKIPYKDPFTGKQTVYVPDFLIQYVDKNNKINTELIEIKPSNQYIMEKVGKNKTNQMMYIKNQAKFAAAQAYCQKQGIKFRIIDETHMFHNGNKK